MFCPPKLPKFYFYLLAACIGIAVLALTDCAKNDADAAAKPPKQVTKENDGRDTMTMHDGYRRITASEAKKMADENPNAVLLDVRTAEEFRERRITGAVLLPVGELQAGAARALPDKEALILIYCRRGNRSRVAANLLLSMGYGNVYDFGGIGDWKYGMERD